MLRIAGCWIVFSLTFGSFVPVFGIQNTSEIQRYLRIAEHNLADAQADSTLFWYRRALNEQSVLSSKDYYSELLDFFNRVGWYDSTRHYLKQWRTMHAEMGPNEEAEYFFSFGNYYYLILDQYDSALLHFHQALVLNEKTKDRHQRVTILQFLAECSVFAEKHKSALTLARDALRIAHEIGLRSKLSSIYLSVSRAFGGLSMEDSSYIYLQKSVAIAEAENDPELLEHAYNDLAMHFFNAGNYERSIVYNHLSLQSTLLNDPNNQYNLSISYDNLASSHLKNDNMDSALYYYDLAFAAIDRRGYVRREAEVLASISEFYVQNGNYEKAYAYLNKSREIQDSLFTAENTAQFEELQTKYEAEKRRAEIESLKLDNSQRQAFTYQVIAFSVLVIACGSAFFFFILGRTRRKRKEMASKADALEELNQMKSQFFVNVAHELRTPLTLVLGPLQDLIDEKWNKRESKGVLIKIKAQARKLLDQTEDILQLAKLEHEKIDLEYQAVELDPFLQTIKSAFEGQALSQEVELQLHNGIGKEEVLLLDRRKVQTILYNLISNALKFSDKGAVISLLVKKSLTNSSLLMIVEDTGRGIRHEDLPHVFDRYYQSRTNAAEGGTGIGLALASELARLMEGTLTVESQMGAGSAFTLEIPLKLADNQHKLKAPEGDAKTYIPSIAQSNKYRVLIVEDHPEMQDYLSQILSSDANILKASNGEEALDVALSEDLDLILTDLMMPRLDGFEFIDRLKGNEKTAGIPIIVVTARTKQEDFSRLFTVGIDDYISKPFESAELLVRVNNVLRNAISRKEALAEDDTPNTNGLSPVDRQWMKRVEEILDRELSNSHFGIAQLADELALSERQVRRRIKQITGLSPLELFREIKLTTARKLIESGQYETVAELAFKVGFQGRNHFVTLYRERFGASPTESLKGTNISD